MFITRDGHELGLSREAARLLLRHSGTLGLQNLLWEQDEANPIRALHRATETLAGRALLEGVRRSPLTGSLNHQFLSVHGAGRYRFLAVPGPSGLLMIRTIRRVSDPDFEDGDGARIANLEVLRHIWGISASLPYHRVLEQLAQASERTRGGITQVRASTRADGAKGWDYNTQARAKGGPGPLAKPDRSYLTPQGQRINVEIDTNPKRADAHIQTLGAFDPQTPVYSLIVDPHSGKVLSGSVHVGGRKVRDLKASQAVAQLPKASHRRDPAGTKASPPKRARKPR